MCEDEFMVDPEATPLDMIKALGDPKRLRIMAALGVPRTVKQVGDYLDEDASTLYYHVKELFRVGLVELVETRVVGGVAEKYYRAVECKADEDLQRAAGELAEKDPEAFARMLGDAVNSILASVMTEFSWFTAHSAELDKKTTVSISEGFVDLTLSEAEEVAKELGRISEDARSRREQAGTGSGEEVHRWCLASFLFPMRPKEEGGAAPA